MADRKILKNGLKDLLVTNCICNDYSFMAECPIILINEIGCVCVFVRMFRIEI